MFLLCAAGRNPTDIAAFLFCSRSRVYRLVRLYRTRTLRFTVDTEGQLTAPGRPTVLMPWIKPSLAALLQAPPRTYGWCRTWWSWATLATPLQAKHGSEVSTWTVRRWLPDMGWCGNGPSGSPKITPRSGASAWLGFAFMPSACQRAR